MQIFTTSILCLSADHHPERLVYLNALVVGALTGRDRVVAAINADLYRRGLISTPPPLPVMSLSARSPFAHLHGRARVSAAITADLQARGLL